MLEKPDLPDEAISDCLRSAFGIEATALDFLPLGADSDAWVYRAEASDGQRHFVKVRRGEINQPGLTVPRFLRDQGITQVIAPQSTLNGDLWATVADYALIVYPFVEGQNAVDAGMSDAQWQVFGAALRRIHSLDLPPELAQQLPREQWPVRSLSFVAALQARIDGGFRNAYEAELADFWSERQDYFYEIEARLGRLWRWIPSQHDDQSNFVLCHADIHRYNILIGPDGRLTIVDWDEVMLAPKERDLMFIGGGVDGPPDAAQAMQFYAGYGAAEINPLLIAYYRYDWLMQDINSFAEWVLLDDELGDATKAQAVQLIKGLFAPGGEAEAAERSYADLPDSQQGRLAPGRRLSSNKRTS